MNTSIDDQVKASAAAKESFPAAPGPIGIFDSGYGGLTILQLLMARARLMSSMSSRVRPYRSSSRWAVSL